MVNERKSNRKFSLAAIVAMLVSVVVLVFSANEIHAWLSNTSSKTVNVFNPSRIVIDITETDTGDGDEDSYTNTYTMVPGEDITKDPTIVVPAETIDCYVFVTIDESSNFKDYLTYTVADEWTALEEHTNVYYMKVSKNSAEQSFAVLKDNTVKLREGVDEYDLNEIEIAPTLTITGYSVQQETFETALEAWESISE